MLGGNCDKREIQCPEDKKCIWQFRICDGEYWDGTDSGYFDGCTDGLDELYCHGRFKHTFWNFLYFTKLASILYCKYTIVFALQIMEI